MHTGATKMVADVIRAAVVETGSTDMLDWAKPRNSYPNAWKAGHPYFELNIFSPSYNTLGLK